MDSLLHDLINIMPGLKRQSPDSLIESYLQFPVSHYIQSKREMRETEGDLRKSEII